MAESQISTGILKHKKEIFILIAITALTFGNSLFNGFIGDDYFLIVNNSFYRSWSNVPHIFTSDYIMDSDSIFNVQEQFFHSGSISYRPVLSLTYFFDYWLWKLNPFGYHLHNLLLHLCNVILVFFLALFILKNTQVALLSAILFSVHPFKTEAVCSIGYRADGLACFFVLLSFLCYIKYHKNSRLKRSGIFILAHIFYFLAIFSKESAIVLLGLILAYDWLVRGQKIAVLLKMLVSRYLGFIFITVFYLYIYLWIFPNSTLDDVGLLGPTIGTHVASIFRIFAYYVMGFILPFSVKVLPPVYAPSMTALGGYKTWLSIFLFVLLIYYLVKARHRSKNVAFFILWFLLSFIPVSNIIPIINPMAYRFMYLPSIGFFIVMAIVLNSVHFPFWKVSLNIQLSKIIKMGFIGLCMFVTIPLNAAWKNGYILASHMVKDFPENPRGYLHLGMEYFARGEFDRAKETLQRGIELGLEDPRAYYYIGLCMFNDFEQSKPYYEKSIMMFPNYALSYIGLGRSYFLQRDYSKALPYLEKSVELYPIYSGCGYLIQTYIQLGRYEDAVAVFKKASKVLINKGFLDSLQKFIDEGDHLENPVDIGI